MKKRILFTSLFIITAIIITSCCGEKKSSPERPNIIFIITDDQSPFTLSAYGNSICETPNIDRLASEGMVFDDARFLGSWLGAVCTPSRTMIQTSFGLWRLQESELGLVKMPRDYVHEPEKHMAEMNPGDLQYYSIPAVFNRAGYTTYRTSKAGNVFEKANRLYKYRSDKNNLQADDENGSWWHGEQIMKFLDEREKIEDTNPFLIFYGFTHPHDPRYGKDHLLEKYGAVNEIDIPSDPDPESPPLQPNYLPAHPFHHGHPGLRDEERVQGIMMNRDETTIRNELGREYACIENVDVQIGRVLKRLEEMGELDNTYIFFTSDHGIAVGRHGLTGKQNLYEHTWRVPFIVTGPGIEEGSRANGNIYLLDVLPTMCELAGLEIPETLDGKSFKSVLEGNDDIIRDVMYGAYAGGTKPGMRAVKRGKWKLIKYDALDGEVRETQLFNLEENPEEYIREHHDPAVYELTGFRPEPHQTDLAEDPEYAEILKEMESLLLEQMIEWRDPYRLWDQPEKEKP